MTRVVLDANVFVSAILSPKGAPARILRAWRDERFQLVVSEPILAEIAQVLRYPRLKKRHGWVESQVDEFVADLAHLAILVYPEKPFAVVAEDPSDNRYLECAVAGAAEYLVSGDQHLLELKSLDDVTILSPAAFVRSPVFGSG
jgi:putative PIN family toxin of toxin-antitoxin system